MYLKSVAFRSKVILQLFNTHSNFFKRTIKRNAAILTQKFSTSQRYNIDLSGIIPPIVTPFNSDESIAYDKLKLNFDKWNKIPFKGYLVEGSNGEYVHLSEEERIELLKKAKEFKAANKILLGGSGCESTKQTIDLTFKMAEAGADAVVVITPSFFKAEMKDRTMHRHYEDIANMSPIPVILYNVPTFTGVELTADAIISLSQHDNIIGLKDSGGDITKIGNIVHQTKDRDFQVLAGSAGFLLASLQLGCVGGVCALANPLGEEVCQLYDLFAKGIEAHKDAANTLQGKLIPVNSAVTKIFGVAGLKEIMDARGYYGGPTRSPLQKLQPKESKKLKSIFMLGGFL